MVYIKFQISFLPQQQKFGSSNDFGSILHVLGKKYFLSSLILFLGNVGNFFKKKISRLIRNCLHWENNFGLG